MNQQLSGLSPDSPEFVVRHAALRRKRGKQPSLPFRGEKNPRMALIRARQCVKRDAYRKLLNRLPIQNPTDDDFAELCPHLTREQAVATFTLKDEQKSIYVALPPLRVRGAFQIVSLSGGQLRSSYAGRTRASYADGMSHGDVFYEYKHTAEAIQYAEKHWGHELVLDTWVSAESIYIQDPSDLNERQYPKGKALLFCVYKRDLIDIVNDFSRPMNELFDDALAEMTLDTAVMNELKGGRGGHTHFACAYCGSALGLRGCGGCGYLFKDDGGRCGGYAPLSKKMIAALQASGHTFKKNPALALEADHKRWKEIQLHRRSSGQHA